MKHLLSIDDLTRDDMERILDRAAAFEEVSDRDIKKVPALRGRTVLNLFYEDSTRTRSSFELAAKRLSADVVYALRMQHERMDQNFVPSLREYAANYQINGRRLGPHQVLMHPGPVNRGVELSGEVVDSPQAVITAQVEAGVVVRMAVLYELVAGAASSSTTVPEPTAAEPHAAAPAPAKAPV